MITNKGEIALRIIQGLVAEMGIENSCNMFKADESAAYLKQADITIIVLNYTDTESSYLNIPSIISAAEITDIEAIHPGYGFIREVGHLQRYADLPI